MTSRSWILAIGGVVAALLGGTSARAQSSERATSAATTAYKLEFDVPKATPAPAASLSPAASTAGMARVRAASPAAMKVTLPRTTAVVNLAEKPQTLTILRKSQAPTALDAANVPPLQQGELLLSKTNQAPRGVAASRPGARAFELPYAARFVDGKGALRTVGIVAELGGGGLRITGAASAFVAEVFVRLQDRDEPSAQGELPQPIEVLTTAPLDRVQPALLQITTLGRWYPVALESKDPPQPVQLKLRASGDVSGLELEVPVSRPKLTLSISPESLPGFGLETATVTVRAEGLPQPSGRVVVLSASSGRLGSTRLSLDKDGLGTTELRSSGAGSSWLTVKSSPLSAESPREVRFGWPLSFLAFALAGGSIGSLISFVRRRDASTGAHRWLELGAGVLVGLVVAVLGALGVNVTGIALPTLVTEAAVLALSAAGALGLAGPLANSAPSTGPAAPHIES